MRVHTNRRNGATFERAVCVDQERIGRVAFRVRQGGGEPVDIVSLDRFYDGHMASSVVWFIQCKRGGPYIPPAEREAFILKAKAAGAAPLVAWRDGKRIEYKRLEVE